MSDWRRSAVHPSITATMPNARSWQREVEDGHLTVLRTIERLDDEHPWRVHLSISHRTNDQPPQPGRYPTWDEQRDAVWQFAPGRAMVSYLPAEGSRYVNLHPTTFHWWETDMPEPGVGVRP
jgi:hypothetical protein